jgi:hypothetical protein
VVLVGPLSEGDVVLPVPPARVEAVVLRGAAGVEQPAIESTTPSRTVTMRVADQTLDPGIRATSLSLINVRQMGESVDQLASWTTEASPTLA